MTQKLKTKLIECLSRKRQVEVTYRETGGFFSRDYNIVSCPAMYDGPAGCNRACKTQIPSSSAYRSAETLI